MPTTRRSTGSTHARSGPTKGQSTISFHNKVTKAVPHDAKKDLISSPAVTKVEPTEVEKPAEKEEVVDVEPEDEDEEDEPEIEAPEIEQVPEKTDAEVKAEKVSDAQVGKYWKAIEKERIAPRVHQQDLTLSEKVLRYFDVSSQYGPCIGITRMKRWTRANRLGLNPPIEVLAVLLKEESKGTKNIETAHVDDILNSGIAVGS